MSPKPPSPSSSLSGFARFLGLGAAFVLSVVWTVFFGAADFAAGAFFTAALPLGFCDSSVGALEKACVCDTDTDRLGARTVRVAWRHVRRGVATYRLRLERVGVILLEVIIDRVCVGVHSEVVCEGLEAQARSRKGLRRLVRGLSRRTDRARKKELRECINGRRLLVGYNKPQGVGRLVLQPGSEGLGDGSVVRESKKQRQQPRW